MPEDKPVGTTPPWRSLWFQYSQDTSLHGIRFITAPTPFVCRRMIWFLIVLAGIVGFVFLNVLDLLLFLDYPKSVNVEVEYQDELTFPSVTICNYNSFRLTKLTEMGLYDQLYDHYNQEDASDECVEHYTYLEGMCIHSTEEHHQLYVQYGLAPVFSLLYEGISQISCEHICTYMHDLECSGIFYNRTSRLCEVTSVIVESEWATPDLKCDLSSLEYYRRYRCLGTGRMLCNLEMEGTCNLRNSTIIEEKEEFSESWIPSQAGSNDPSYDHSMETGRGWYYYMLSTSSRADYTAKMTSRFMVTDGTCFEFFYFVIASDEFEIKVTVKTEDLTVVLEEVRRENQDSDDWKRFFMELPNGTHVIEIEGHRPASATVSGAAIDTVSVAPCSYYYRDCKRTTKGSEYLGNLSTSETGAECLPWNSVIYGLSSSFSFPDGSAEAAGNKCRLVEGAPRTLPWCTIGPSDVEYCNVPFCACMLDQFRCDSGKCIAKKFTCDGVDDCGDLSDEKDTDLCGRRAITCDFSEEYMCGYINIAFTTLMFARTKGYEVSDGIGPTLDSSGSSLGYFVFADARDGVEGDRAVFESPASRLTPGHCLSMQIFVVNSASSTADSLVFFKLKFEQAYIEPIPLLELDLENWPSSQWTELHPRLPPGYYSLRMDYVMGYPYECDLALDDIVLSLCEDLGDVEIQETNEFDAIESDDISCDFNKEHLCNYDQISTSVAAGWVPVPKDFVSEAFAELVSDTDDVTTFTSDYFAGRCLSNEYALSGKFQSPSYPKNYPTYYSECILSIHGPAGANTSICFPKFNIQLSDNCSDARIEIYSGSYMDPPVYTLCNSNYEYMANGTLTGLSNQVWVVFITGSVTKGTGFRGTYQMDFIDGIDYVMAANIKGYLSDSVYNVQLHSPVISLPKAQPASLTFSLISAVKVEVKARGATDEVLLDTNIDTGMLPWNRYCLLLPVGTYQVAFVSAIPGSMTGFFTALDDVVFNNATCQDVYTEGSLTCDFSDLDMCGYIDVSPYKYKWRRATTYKPSNTQLIADDGTSSNSLWIQPTDPDFLSVSMLSPVIEVTSPVCFQAQVATYFMEGTVVFYDVLMSPSGVDQYTYLGKVSSPFPMYYQVELALGTRRIMFTAKSMKWDIIWVQELRLLNGACPTEGALNFDYDPNDTTAPLYAGMPSAPLAINASTSLVGQTPEFAGFPEIVMAEASSHKDVAAFTDVYTLFTYTAHEKDDFIYSCKWNGTECPEDFIDKEVSDFGVCYTFNPLSSIQLNTDKPGSRYGLQLVLNIEQYEHTQGENTDAGVKAHMHSRYDIPNVRDVGAAAALSTHTLFGVRYTKTLSLPYPYGTCQDQEFELFDSNENYTRARCQQECETIKLNDTCQCKLYYMPGEIPYCTGSEYLTCVLEKWDRSPSGGDCGCADSCEVVAYNVEPSVSTLSELGVTQLLGSNTSLLREKYINAMELQHRMEPSLLQETINKLESVKTVVEEFLEYADQVTSLSPTSALSLIRQSMYDFLAIIASDIEAAFSDFPVFVQMYQSLFAWKHSSVTSRFREACESIAFLTELAAVQASMLQEELSENETRVELHKLHTCINRTVESITLAFSASRFAIGVPHLMSDKTPETYIYTPTKLYPSADIQETCSNLGATLPELNDFISNASLVTSFGLYQIKQGDLQATLDGVNSIPWAAILNYMNDQFISYSECTSYYPNLLTAISNWIETISTNIDIDLGVNYNFEQESEPIRKDLDWFVSDILEAYLLDGIRKVEMAEMLDEVWMNNLISEVTTTRSYIMSKFIDEMRTIVDEWEVQTVAIYTDILEALENMQVYFDATLKVDFSTRAKSMNIWRIPVCQLNGITLIDYTYSPEEIWHTWPTYFGISDFAENLAEITLETINYGVFEVMIKSLTDMETTLTVLESNITDALNDIGSSLKDYQESLEINENFIMNNFLAVDVYYGELTFSLMQQQAGYPLSNFFSDLGGYMGLLLGGSVITLAELLDVIFYNAMLKCHDRRRGRQRARSQERAEGKTGAHSNKAFDTGNDATLSAGFDSRRYSNISLPNSEQNNGNSVAYSSYQF